MIPAAAGFILAQQVARMTTQSLIHPSSNSETDSLGGILTCGWPCDCSIHFLGVLTWRGRIGFELLRRLGVLQLM